MSDSDNADDEINFVKEKHGTYKEVIKNGTATEGKTALP